MLLNEYNYISKLILEGRLEERFATDMGVGNFKRVHENATQLIRLRRKLSESYASHFTQYVNRMSAKR